MAMDGSERNFLEGAEEVPEGAPAPTEPRVDDLETQIVESLRSVIDPELGINIVDLGLVYDVRVEDRTVHIDYTLTTMGCPIGPMIEAQIQQLLKDIDGVDDLQAELVFSPPWTPDKMSEEAKAALGVF
jgi:metal-sulfur cluster biosynthetic enzyme